MRRFKILAAATLLAATGGTASADDREKSLRFPPDVLKNAPYAADVAPDYRHASPAAYDQFRAMKYGVRIHWGLYSMLPASRESWSFLPLPDPDRQASLRGLLAIGFVGSLLACFFRSLTEAPGEKLHREEYETAREQYAKRTSRRTGNPSKRRPRPLGRPRP